MIRPISLSPAIILSGLLVVGCNKSPLGSTDNAPAEKEVSGEIHKVDLVPWTTNTRCQGSLVADETTTLSAKVAGRVESVLVDVGDLVDPEKMLVQLDPTDFQLLAEQADAQLQQARAAVGLKPGDPLENLNPEKAPPVQEAKALLDEATQTLARMTSLATEDDWRSPRKGSRGLDISPR
ncbi:MAG: biotin/lipoyl-binding protein [Pirellula sp.]|nr:biotin/lipoyl-binding protein [Pirellula sp.]